MGDRANIVFMDGHESPPLFFYTHWHGFELPVTLQNALARRKRWDDGQYLARIIFEEMISGDIGSSSGFGISTYIGDNEYPLLLVDVKEQKVKLVRYVAVLPPPNHPEPEAEWTFAQYVGLDLTPTEEGDHWDKLKSVEQKEAV